MAINEQIFQQRQQLEHAVAQALDIATKHQATAEVSISKSTGLSVSARLGEVENIEFNNDGALGIAVYKGQHKGSASTTDLSEQAIIKTVQAALDIAHYTSEDPFTGLADQALMAYEVTDLDLYHPPVINTEQAIESVIRAEHSALQQDKRIVNSDGASFSGHQGVKVYGNTHGMLQSYCLSRYSLSCCVVAQENEQMERDYAYTLARDYHALIDDKAVGLESADKVLARLGTRSLPTMTVPVLFAADVAASLFGHLVAAISGGNLFRKTSFLLDSLGQKIFPEQVSIFEDPWIKKGLASSPFDSEGVKTQPKMIVDQGVIQTYLLSSYSARKLSMTTTGHAGGIHNWLVQGKGGDFEQMLKTLGTGLLVTELMGQGVNIINGDYSRGACGFWVENGQIQYPVSEITIAGDLPNMFRQIVVIGNDVEKRGSIQTGSVLVESMRIAGQ